MVDRVAGQLSPEEKWEALLDVSSLRLTQTDSPTVSLLQPGASHLGSANLTTREVDPSARAGIGTSEALIRPQRQPVLTRQRQELRDRSTVSHVVGVRGKGLCPWHPTL